MKYLIMLLVALAAGGGCFYGGYVYRGDPGVQIVTQTRVEEREHVVTKVVKVTEQQKAPNGTVTEKVTETTTSDKAEVTHHADVAVDRPQPVPDSGAYRPDWSVGARWDVRSLDTKPEFNGVDVGYRVLGNAWTTVGFDLERRGVTVGVRVDF